jgi:hypothetical protein
MCVYEGSYPQHFVGQVGRNEPVSGGGAVHFILYFVLHVAANDILYRYDSTQPAPASLGMVALLTTNTAALRGVFFAPSVPRNTFPDSMVRPTAIRANQFKFCFVSLVQITANPAFFAAYVGWGFNVTQGSISYSGTLGGLLVRQGRYLLTLCCSLRCNVQTQTQLTTNTSFSIGQFAGWGLAYNASLGYGSGCQIYSTLFYTNGSLCASSGTNFPAFTVIRLTCESIPRLSPIGGAVDSCLFGHQFFLGIPEVGCRLSLKVVLDEILLFRRVTASTCWHRALLHASPPRQRPRPPRLNPRPARLLLRAPLPLHSPARRP